MDKDTLRRWPGSRAGRRLLVTLAVIGGLLVVIRLVLDPIAAFFTRKALNQSPDFSGAFADVHVTLFPPGYEISRLKIIQQPGGDWKAPLVYAERSRIDILWRELLRGHVVANVWVDAPKLRIPSRQEKETVEKTRTIGQRLQEMFPLRIDRVDIDRGEILLASGTGRNAAELWIHDGFLVAENLATRKALAEGEASFLRARAKVQRSGDLRLSFDMDPWAKGLTFSGKAALKTLRLRDLHAFFANRTDLHASQGTISVFAQIRARNGRLSGGIKPVLKNVEIESADQGLGNRIKAALADVTLDIFEDDDAGKNDRATAVVPIRGTISDPNAQLVPTILGVIRNAFVTGLGAGFSGVPPPTADEDENIFEQAWEALQKDEGQPEAQPQEGSDKPSGAGS